MQAYGAQAVVVSVDPRRVYVSNPAATPHRTVETTKPGPNGERYVWWQCTVNGGREGRDLGAVELAQAVEKLGAGEILLNCIDNDGQVCSRARTDIAESAALSGAHGMASVKRAG